MKTILLSTLFFLGSLASFGQDIYQQKMGEAMQTYASVSSVDDYKAAAANFERIANVETDKWLPLYYQAQCYIMMSFSDNEANQAEKDAYLAVAKPLIDRMIEIAPQESEVYALEALYYTAKLVINPMTRGAEYGALTNTSIQKALAIDAKNPRALQLELSNKVGTANFFGKDIAPYCVEAEALLADWDNYEIRGPFYPTWGKDQVESILKNCKSTSEVNTTESTPTPAPEKTGHTLAINIHKLNSNDGYIMLELLDENENTITQTMGTVENKTAVITLDGIEPGTYAVRFYHDENENKKMDTNKYGIPQESYGFSNNARGFMGPPKYKKLLFEVEENTTIKLNAR